MSGLKENGLSFVYGVEGDWSWLGGVKLSEGNAELSRSFDVRWVATLRGRAGLAFDATLVYITGGLALGGVDNSLIANIDDGGLTGSFIDDKTRLGWTAGVGCLAASCGRAARQLCPRFPCVRSCRSRCSPRYDEGSLRVVSLADVCAFPTAYVEHMFAPHWTLRGEWRYVDLGTHGAQCANGNDVCTGTHVDFSNTLMLGLVGLAYKF